MLQLMADSWPRWEHFRHYMDSVRCTYSMTVQIDITEMRQALRAEGLKAYPVQIYLLATTVNRFPNFRMGLSEQGEPGYWDVLHPAYTIFHSGTETFSSIWTTYEVEFSRFYRACIDDMECFAHSTAFFPKENLPPNLFDISSVPWIDFSAFNLNVYAEGTHLPPIFTIGKYIEENGRTLLPLGMQLHHAACDGYHAGSLLKRYETWRRIIGTGLFHKSKEKPGIIDTRFFSVYKVLYIMMWGMPTSS